MPRIRGAIIDGLRVADWVPRSVRAKTRDIERAQVNLECRLGRTPTNPEIARELHMTARDLRRARANAAYISVASIDELGGVEDMASLAGDLLEDEESRGVLMDAVKNLAERDRIIVALYYFEGLTLSEIGQVLGLTESRISQLHTRIASALRAKLTRPQAA